VQAYRPAGSITIDSSPSNAEIELDNQPVGKTPATLTMPKGVHGIIVSKDGFFNWNKTMYMGETSVRLKAVLEAESTRK
jgi:hypothetical protein